MAARIKRGDRVRVISGRDKGKEGRVLRVFPRKGTAVVEGVHLVKRHLKRGPGGAGEIMEREAPIRLSKLMPICPKCGEATRVGFRFKDDGTKVRYCKRCGEEMD